MSDSMYANLMAANPSSALQLVVQQQYAGPPIYITVSLMSGQCPGTTFDTWAHCLLVFLLFVLHWRRQPEIASQPNPLPPATPTSVYVIRRLLRPVDPKQPCKPSASSHTALPVMYVCVLIRASFRVSRSMGFCGGGLKGSCKGS